MMKTQFISNFLKLASTLCITYCLLIGNATADTKHEVSHNTVAIKDAWVRTTGAGQDVGAAYMTLTSKRNVSLIHVESSVTKNVEIHSMSMEKGVMKMRMLEALELSANKPSMLAPGSFHLMLFDLKKPLREGEKVNFELTFKTKDKKEFKQKISVNVKALDHAQAHHEHHH